MRQLRPSCSTCLGRGSGRERSCGASQCRPVLFGIVCARTLGGADYRMVHVRGDHGAEQGLGRMGIGGRTVPVLSLGSHCRSIRCASIAPTWCLRSLRQSERSCVHFGCVCVARANQKARYPSRRKPFSQLLRPDRGDPFAQCRDGRTVAKGWHLHCDTVIRTACAGRV